MKVEEEKLAKVLEGLKSETQGLQEEKDKHESKLLSLQKGVNEAKSKVQFQSFELLFKRSVLYFIFEFSLWNISQFLILLCEYMV